MAMAIGPETTCSTSLEPRDCDDNPITVDSDSRSLSNGDQGQVSHGRQRLHGIRNVGKQSARSGSEQTKPRTYEIGGITTHQARFAFA